MPATPLDVSEIRIVDNHVVDVVNRERRRANESTSTKTAQRMILGYAAQQVLLEKLEKARRGPSAKE